MAESEVPPPGKLAVIVAVCLPALVGCAPGTPGWNWLYALDAAAGELGYLGLAVPIEDGLADPDLTEDQRYRLQFVIQARDYAEQVLGLNVGTSYSTFVNLQGRPLAWNLSASRKDALEAYTWDIPFAGRIPYLGFFNHDAGLAERDRLVAAGYDTLLYELDAYSTLGLLPDPVASTLLKRPLANLADTVFHELLHNTVWHVSDTVFNESLATFVGRAGAIAFFEDEFGADSPLLEEARNGYEDNDRINAFLQELAGHLRELYARDMTSDEKIARREEVFENARRSFTEEVQPTLHAPSRYAGYGTLNYNNAFVLVNVRYNSDLQIFADVHESTGRNWARSLGIFQQAAGESDPFAFLRHYIKPIPSAGRAD